MELNLLPILNFDGRKMDFDLTLEMENRPGDGFRFKAPVRLTGQVANLGGGCLEITAQGTALLETACDRCAEVFVREFPFRIAERFRREGAVSGQDNPDLIPLEGSAVDLEELAYTSLFTSLPTRILCTRDCKGLCPVCGRNLNNGSCGCQTRETDPRFDILDELL